MIHRTILDRKPTAMAALERRPPGCNLGGVRQRGTWRFPRPTETAEGRSSARGRAEFHALDNEAKHHDVVRGKQLMLIGCLMFGAVQLC